MRFCSASARSSSALMSSRVLTTLGWVRIAVQAASAAGAVWARAFWALNNSTAAMRMYCLRVFILPSAPVLSTDYSGSPFAGRASELHLDQPRPLLRHRLIERLDKIVRCRHRAALHAHAFGERDKIQRRA